VRAEIGRHPSSKAPIFLETLIFQRATINGRLGALRHEWSTKAGMQTGLVLQAVCYRQSSRSGLAVSPAPGSRVRAARPALRTVKVLWVVFIDSRGGSGVGGRGGRPAAWLPRLILTAFMNWNTLELVDRAPEVGVHARVSNGSDLPITTDWLTFAKS